MKLAKKLLLESASFAGQDDILPVGEDLEVGNVQYHRYAHSLEATDISNSGKKGKTAKQVSLYGAYDNNDNVAIEAFIADSIMKLKNIDDVEKAFHEIASTHKEDGWKVETHLKKGVDVYTKLGNELTIDNDKLHVTVTPKNVSFNDKTDKYNDMSGYVNPDKKRDLKKAWEVIFKSKDEVEKMNFQQFKDFLSSHNIDYRTYAGMD